MSDFVVVCILVFGPGAFFFALGLHVGASRSAHFTGSYRPTIVPEHRRPDRTVPAPIIQLRPSEPGGAA